MSFKSLTKYWNKKHFANLFQRASFRQVFHGKQTENTAEEWLTEEIHGGEIPSEHTVLFEGNVNRVPGRNSTTDCVFQGLYLQFKGP